MNISQARDLVAPASSYVIYVHVTQCRFLLTYSKEKQHIYESRFRTKNISTSCVVDIVLAVVKTLGNDKVMAR